MIEKFHFEQFDVNSNRQIQKVRILDGYNGKIVSAFRLDITPLIIVLYLTNKSPNTLHFKYYDDNLEFKGEKHFWDISNPLYGEGIFFKLIPMKDNYFSLAFFDNGNNGQALHFHLKKYVNMFDYDTLIHHYDFSSFTFKTDIQSNELFKLNDNRVVLLTTSDYNSIDYGLLHMFFIDFYDNYVGMKMREYRFYYPEKRFVKEMSAYDYNGYVIFTTTLDNTDNSGYNIFSIFMIFGFVNVTDYMEHTIDDFYKYLMDTDDYNESNNYLSI